MCRDGLVLIQLSVQRKEWFTLIIDSKFNLADQLFQNNTVNYLIGQESLISFGCSWSITLVFSLNAFSRTEKLNAHSLCKKGYMQSMGRKCVSPYIISITTFFVFFLANLTNFGGSC